MSTAMNMQELSLENLKEILKGVPSAKSCISGKVKAAVGWDKKQNKYVMCGDVYKFHWVENDWRIYSYSWPEFVLNFISISDILTRIAELEGLSLNIANVLSTINQDRMQTALTADTFLVPEGLSREQLRRFIIDSGKK